MPATDPLIAFALATAIFAYLPGPAMLYAAAQTMAGGRRAGWLAALGIHVGGYAHVVAAALGLAVLFQAVPVAYAAVKLAGAGYLVWLGVGMIRAGGSLAAPDPGSVAGAPRRAFWQSVTVEVLNPKAAIFYLAFLPQFTDPAATLPVWVQLFVLGTLVNLMFSSADVACVLLADRMASALRGSARAQRLIRRTGGAILVGLGLNLALGRQ